MQRIGYGRATALISVAVLAMEDAAAEPFRLEPVVVTAPEVHPSQAVRSQVTDAFRESRTSSSSNGAALQNLNPVNKGDALRYNTIGLINTPGGGDRFGGGVSIRTFGDFGAGESIDGLPAFKSAGEEGGGYSNTIVPSIAVDRIVLQKGGRGVGFGDGSDGGVIETRIKSGRGYDDHRAATFDVNSAREGLVQAEAADGAEKWDYYLAGNYLQGRYEDGEPDNLSEERQFGGLGKVGLNYGDDTRAEFLAIGDRNRPDIIRNGVVEEITTEAYILAATLDHRLTDTTSLRVGHQYTDSRSQWPARSRDRGIDTHISFAEGYLTADLAKGIRYDGSVGAESKRTNYLRDNIYDLVFDDVSLKTSNSLTFNDNLVLNLGLRQVFFENDLEVGGVTQPDNLTTDQLTAYEVGASYDVIPGTRVRGVVATGYNRFYEKYGNFGNDALNPAGAQDEIVESVTLEAGVNQSWATGSLDVAVYSIEQENVPRREGGAIESVTVEQTGLEIEATNRFTDRLTLSAGYMRLLDVDATRADGSPAFGNVFFGTNGVPVPTDQVLLRGNYEVTRSWQVWAMGYFNSGYERIDATDVTTQTRDFYRVDLGTSYQPIDPLVLRFRIENLLDQRDYGQTLEGAPVADAGKLGRVFWVGLDYTF